MKRITKCHWPVLAFCALVSVFWSGLAASGGNLRNPGFAEKYGWSEGDTLVVIPAYVKKVPPFAFAGIRNLKHVRFAVGSECRMISEFCFAECQDLEDIEFPPGLVALGEGVFRECRSLRVLEIPAGVWFLPKEFCNHCVSLERVALPAELREIRAFAFADCGRLKGIEFPASLREIGNNAFSRCAALREITLPEGVEKLESYAFSDCANLRAARLSRSYNMIGELIFSGCGMLESLTVPSAKPPRIECESYLFEPDDEAAYERCRLYVPAGSVKFYSYHHGWRLFRHIVGMSEN